MIQESLADLVLYSIGGLTDILFVVTLLFLVYAIAFHFTSWRYRKLKTEQQRICSTLLHLEERYDERCPAVAIAVRYIMFSDAVEDDEDLQLLDELLRDELPRE